MGFEEDIVQTKEVASRVEEEEKKAGEKGTKRTCAKAFLCVCVYESSSRPALVQLSRPCNPKRSKTIFSHWAPAS